MRIKPLVHLLLILCLGYIFSISGSGCAQIGAPTGGAKDTIPPTLLSVTPELNSTGFTSNRITLSFDEYVEVRDVQNNVLISPYPKNNPIIDYRLRTVTIRLKDSLLPNTTYVINFGNAIQDINEGNPLKDFTYVFSTGTTIDSLSLSGKVIMAETGKADSTLFALLYRNADDSAVLKRRPDYLARLSGDGSFTFTNLPPGEFKVYALKDGDGGKTYNSRIELFAFTEPVTVGQVNAPVQLFAYSELKDTRGVTTVVNKPDPPSRKLRYSAEVPAQSQDLLKGLELSFNKPLKDFDPSKIVLTDTSFLPVVATLTLDSTRRKITVNTQWTEDFQYRLIIDTLAVSDSSGNSIAKKDTIYFTTRREADYGNVLLRFTGLDLAKHPILQLVQGEEIKGSYPLTTNSWTKKLVTPGEYDIRILYDDNNNGKWDPGNYSLKKQPEIVITIPQKLGIRANWDNEQDIKF